MGTQGTENCEFGPEHRDGTGIVYGMRWAEGHPHFDLSHTRWKALRDLATVAQTVSGWRAEMTTAEQTWWDAQTDKARSGILAMAKHALAKGAYSSA